MVGTSSSWKAHCGDPPHCFSTLRDQRANSSLQIYRAKAKRFYPPNRIHTRRLRPNPPGSGVSIFRGGDQTSRSTFASPYCGEENHNSSFRLLSPDVFFLACTWSFRVRHTRHWLTRSGRLSPTVSTREVCFEVQGRQKHSMPSFQSLSVQREMSMPGLQEVRFAVRSIWGKWPAAELQIVVGEEL